MSTLQFATQVMTQVVWHSESSDSYIEDMKQFGWTVSETSTCRTKLHEQKVTVLVRICSYSEIQTMGGGPAFVKLV